MSFFKQFPNATYQFEPGTSTAITDIFRHVDVNDRLSSDINSYTYYEIQDGERPDNVSQKLYGTPDFYWTFFIVNESLKNGIDDWPKSYSAVEAELKLEYDNLGSMTFVPKSKGTANADGFVKFNPAAYEIETQVTPLQATEGSYDPRTIQNNFSGLDLSYSDLRVSRCLETAKIVNWNEKTLQLTMTDFSNRQNFFANSDEDIDLIRGSNLIDIPRGGQFNEPLLVQLPREWLRKMYFTFNDWPTIGQNGANGTNFFPLRSAGQNQNVQDENSGSATTQNQNAYTETALNTMTIERAEWMVEAFRWLDGQFVDAQQSYPNLPDGAGRPQMPYAAFLNYYKDIDETFQSAALKTWRYYFVPNPVTAVLPFKGFIANKLYSNFREAPKYYYKGSNTEDVVNAYDVFGEPLTKVNNNNISLERQAEIAFGNVDPVLPLPGTDPDRYVSHYDALINEKNEKSQIKVVKPELIRQFAQTYKNLIGLGSTLTGRVTGVEGTAVEGAGASQSVSAPISGTTTTGNVGGSTGGGGGGGVSSGGGGGGY